MVICRHVLLFQIQLTVAKNFELYKYIAHCISIYFIFFWSHKRTRRVQVRSYFLHNLAFFNCLVFLFLIAVLRIKFLCISFATKLFLQIWIFNVKYKQQEEINYTFLLVSCGTDCSLKSILKNTQLQAINSHDEMKIIIEKLSGKLI